MTGAPRAYLFDLDGVLRVRDPQEMARVEARHGVRPGRIGELAHAPDRHGPAVLGEVSDQQWRADLAAALAGEIGAEAALECVLDWSENFGRLDPEAVAYLVQLRAGGAQVALVVNATDRLELELVALGLSDSFDTIVNSARTGVAKPDSAMYTIAAGILAVPTSACLYVGTRPELVAGAERTGMAGHLYAGVPGLRARVDPRTAP